MKERKEQNQTAKLGWLLFGLYIAISILLPSGTIYGINVKIPVFVLLTVLGFQILAAQSTALLQLSLLAMVGVTATVWAFRSLFNPFYATWSLSQYKDVLTTLIGCLLVRLFTLSPTHRMKFVRLCIYTVAFGSFLKVFMVVYAFATGASVSDLVDRISVVFRVKLMSIDLDEIGGRLQFPSDNILPLCTFAIFALRKRLGIRSWVSLMIVVLFVVSSMYTFSRFIWASTALAACLAMLVSGKDKVRWVYLGFTVAVTAYFCPR